MNSPSLGNDGGSRADAAIQVRHRIVAATDATVQWGLLDHHALLDGWRQRPVLAYRHKWNTYTTAWVDVGDLSAWSRSRLSWNVRKSVDIVVLMRRRTKPVRVKTAALMLDVTPIHNTLSVFVDLRSVSCAALWEFWEQVR